MKDIQRIIFKGELIAIIISNLFVSKRSEFQTPESSILQVGQIILGPNKPIKKHFHNPIERVTNGTAEVLILTKGRVEVTLYASNLKMVHSAVLLPGDIICLLAGGHEFKASEESIFLEVKNGPFAGQDDKVYF